MSAAARLLALALLVVAGVVGARARRLRRAAGAADWRQVALVLEVWALCLDAGAPASDALTEAAAVDPGVTGAALSEVGTALAAGDPVEASWAPLVDRVDAPPALVAAGAAAHRCERDGLALAPVLRALAATERAATASRGLVTARRTAVWAVLPLGLCYLPAYVLLGVVPAVVGLLHTGG